jgi:hypothetical protein
MSKTVTNVASFNEAVAMRAMEHERVRCEMIAAASDGVRAFLTGIRGANACRNAKIVKTDKGFCVQYGDDNRVYFDTTHM